jgi:hypothetical protein
VTLVFSHVVSLWPLLCPHNAWVGTANPLCGTIKISKGKHICDASVLARDFTVTTFVPAQCVGRDCESSLRTIHEGVHRPPASQRFVLLEGIVDRLEPHTHLDPQRRVIRAIAGGEDERVAGAAALTTFSLNYEVFSSQYFYSLLAER